MKYCSNCGAPVEDAAKFCTNCGQKMEESTKPAEAETPKTEEVLSPTPTPVQTTYTPPQAASQKRELNMGQLVWSIINLLCCCTPLGIVALIFTILAQNEVLDENAEKKLRTAKICNIIGTVVGVIYVLCVGAFYITALVSATTM